MFCAHGNYLCIKCVGAPLATCLIWWWVVRPPPQQVLGVLYFFEFWGWKTVKN